jgi:vancomycin permeability regulator SanA
VKAYIYDRYGGPDDLKLTEVGAYGGFRTKVREVLSRVRAVADVEILGSEPRHFGEPVRL